MLRSGRLDECCPAMPRTTKQVTILFFLRAGQQGLAAVARASDERGPKTSLTEAICKFVGVRQPQDLLG